MSSFLTFGKKPGTYLSFEVLDSGFGTKGRHLSEKYFGSAAGGATQHQLTDSTGKIYRDPSFQIDISGDVDINVNSIAPQDELIFAGVKGFPAGTLYKSSTDSDSTYSGWNENRAYGNIDVKVHDTLGPGTVLPKPGDGESYAIGDHLVLSDMIPCLSYALNAGDTLRMAGSGAKFDLLATGVPDAVAAGGRNYSVNDELMVNGVRIKVLSVEYLTNAIVTFSVVDQTSPTYVGTSNNVVVDEIVAGPSFESLSSDFNLNEQTLVRFAESSRGVYSESTNMIKKQMGNLFVNMDGSLLDEFKQYTKSRSKVINLVTNSLYSSFCFRSYKFLMNDVQVLTSTKISKLAALYFKVTGLNSAKTISSLMAGGSGGRSLDTMRRYKLRFTNASISEHAMTVPTVKGFNDDTRVELSSTNLAQILGTIKNKMQNMNIKVKQITTENMNFIKDMLVSLELENSRYQSTHSNMLLRADVALPNIMKVFGKNYNPFAADGKFAFGENDAMDGIFEHFYSIKNTLLDNSNIYANETIRRAVQSKASFKFIGLGSETPLNNIGYNVTVPEAGKWNLQLKTFTTAQTGILTSDDDEDASIKKVLNHGNINYPADAKGSVTEMVKNSAFKGTFNSTNNSTAVSTHKSNAQVLVRQYISEHGKSTDNMVLSETSDKTISSTDTRQNILRDNNYHLHNLYNAMAYMWLTEIPGGNPILNTIDGAFYDNKGGVSDLTTMSIVRVA